MTPEQYRALLLALARVFVAPAAALLLFLAFLYVTGTL
jgi:hypothetical protein